MFESFVIALREGVEVALVLGILFAVLGRAGRRDLYRPVRIGLVAALFASIGAAFVLSALPIDGEAWEGALYWTSAAFVGSMLFWMHRTSHRIRSSIEERVSRAAGSGEAWALGAFAFLMVFREGAETVLLLAAVRLTTEGVLSSIGAAAGLALALAFGVFFARGSVRVDLRRFFAVTEAVLVLFLIQLLVNGYHELSEAGLVPATTATMAVVGPIVRHDALFVLALVGLPLFVWSSRPDAPVEPAGTGEAERRLAQARMRRERSWRRAGVAATVAVLLAVGVGYAAEHRPEAPPPPEEVVAVEGRVRLPKASFADGRLRRFQVEAGGRAVRFLVLDPGDGRLRTAFDACEICGAKGYRQEGERLLCLNCEAEIVPATLGRPGGCNPIPLPSRVEGETLVIELSDLAAGARWFETALDEGARCVGCGMGIPAGGDPVCGMAGCRERFEAGRNASGP